MRGIRCAVLGALLALPLLGLLSLRPGVESPATGNLLPHASSAAGFLGLGIGSPGPGDRAEISVGLLAEALGDRRPIEPRLTGGFPYAACEAPPDRPDDLVRLGSCSPLPAPGSAQFRTLGRASGRLLTGSGSGASADLFHARGVWHLLWYRQPGEAERAVETLEAAAAWSSAQDAVQARILSDLSAAYLVRAAERDRPADLVQALDAAAHALERSPDLPEALFNRALALEKLRLRTEAKRAWEAYLAEHPAGPWAAEARARHRGLDKPTVREAWAIDRELLALLADHEDLAGVRALLRRYAPPARDWIEEDLLSAWGDAVLAERPADAEKILHRARTVAEVLAQRVGEHLPADAIAAIDGADAGRRAELAAGHAAFGEAVEHYGRQDCAAAAEAFQAAEHHLESGASPLAARAILGRESCTYFRDPDRALPTLDALKRELPLARYPTLHARIEWMIGLCKDSKGDPAGAEPHYRRAITRLDDVGDPDRGALYTFLGLTREALGDGAGAWTARLTSLALLAPYGTPRHLYNSLHALITSLLHQERPDLALHFQGELLDQVTRWTEPAALTDAHLTRARILLDLGQTPEALDDLQQAEASLDQVPEGVVKRRLLGDLLGGTGESLVRQNPEGAERSITRALAVYQRTGHLVRVPRLLTARAQARLRLGRVDQAEKDLVAAIGPLDAGPEGGRRAEALRSNASTRRMDEAMVRLQLDDRGNPAAALAWLERLDPARLPERAGSLPTGNGASENALLRALPTRVTLVRYFVLEDRLVLWVLGKTFRTIERPIPAAELTRHLDAFVAAIETEAPEATIRRLGAPLYDALIRPAFAESRPGDTLLLVPDRSLQGLPFAALWNASTGRYLVEELPLARTTGLRQVLLRGTGRLFQEEPPARHSILAVGTSAFDHERYDDLPELPRVEEEAEEVTALYPSGDLLLGDEATPRNLLQHLSEHPDVVHIAAHTVVDPAHPERSVLLLAPDVDPPDDGTLAFGTRAGGQLLGTDLVFLSACRSASVWDSFAPADPSAATAQDAGDGPVIIATLWKVEDGAAAALSSRFHRLYVEGADAASALRTAQMELIRQPSSHPAQWAGFVATLAPGRGSWPDDL